MKNFRTRYLLLLIALFLFTNSFAQERLTLKQAVDIALENNYDIKLISNDLKISKNNVNLAAAGILPVVNGTFTDNNSIQNSEQTAATGVVTTRKGARNTNINYGANLNWTIFDGLGMFARYDNLQELQKLGESNLKLTILNTVSDVIGTYFNLVQQKQQLQAADTAVYISRLRVETAQNRYTIGKAAKLEVLNANIALNTDTTNLLRQRTTYHNTQITLNQLLARDVNTQFSVDDSITIDANLNFQQLSTAALQQNPSLQAAIISQNIANLNLKTVKARRYPTIGLTSGYSFTRSTSALGFASRNLGRGFSYGVTASMNIFNGFLQSRNEQNARTNIESTQLDYKRVELSVNAQLSAAYQTYLTSLELVKLEKNNERIAKQNLDITLEKFRIGSITPLEFRDAQLNYVSASVRFTSAQYEAKLAEISLNQIAGTLRLDQ